MSGYDEQIEWAKGEFKKIEAKKQDIILTLADRLENNGMATETICEYISNELSKDGYVSSRYVREALPEKYKNKKLVREQKRAEVVPPLAITNEGNTVTEPNDTSKDSNEITPSFSSALDLSSRPEGPDDFKFKKEEYPPLNINEDLKTEIERLKEINDRYSTELTELREAVTKTSFKPAGEVKSFTFNDLPAPDEMNTFSYQNIDLPTFRMALGQLMLTKTNWNIWMERTK